PEPNGLMATARHEPTLSNRPSPEATESLRGQETTELPVCVDLDGTLIAGDLFWESLARLLRRRPQLLFMLPLWALKGRAFVKHDIAPRAPVDAANLPYRREVLDILKIARVKGARITLATGADLLHANQVAQHLGLFSEVIASADGVNVSGRNKARILVERFGRAGFHYFGNDRSDLHVWAVAASATVVAASPGVVSAGRRTVHTQAVLAPAAGLASSIARAVRPHQWVKNLLVFVPLLASHKLQNLAMFEACAWTFVSFSLCASAIYILNDIADLDADRLHARKEFSPLAC